MVHPEISVLCLIGLPASGKTHLSSLIVKHKLGFTEVVVFSYDNLIKWSTDNFVWKEERKNVFFKVENKIFHYKKMCNEKLLIILDDNMYYRSMRYEFYKLTKKEKIKFCQLYVNSPLTTCLLRNSNRTPSLPTYHILQINEKLEVPCYYKSWEKNTLIVSGEENFEKYLDSIKIFIESAHLSAELDVDQQLTQPHNSKHIADIASRRIISLLVKEMKSYGKCDMVAKISELNKRKSEIMNHIKEDKLHLPLHQDIEIYIQHLFPIIAIGQKKY